LKIEFTAWIVLIEKDGVMLNLKKNLLK
jgi:hypothetical protein